MNDTHVPMSCNVPDMSHRDELLIAAKHCLQEKGYGRTTARDIVATSGTNLASIGYHYGSKDALLNLAMLDTIGDWGQKLGLALQAAPTPVGTPMDRFETIWTVIIDLFAEHRQLWLTNFEVFAQVEHIPAVRVALMSGLEQGRDGLARMFHGDIADERTAWAVGSFYQALITGLMAQWLIDPSHAPTGEDMRIALRTVVEGSRPTSLA